VADLAPNRKLPPDRAGQPPDTISNLPDTAVEADAGSNALPPHFTGIEPNSTPDVRTSGLFPVNALGGAMNVNAMFDFGFFELWFLFVLSYIAAAGIQQALRNPDARRLGTDGELTPCDVAYLSGGAERALLSALTALKVAEMVTVDDRTVRAIGRPRPELDALQRAVLAATIAPVPRSLLPDHPAVAAALAAIETRLIEEGLLLSDRRRRLILLVGVIPLAVAVSVLVEIVFIVVETHSVFTGIFGLVAAVFAVRHFRWLPRRSNRGDRALSKLRHPHSVLSPQRRSSGSDDDATGAALSVGIYGHEAVRTCDPGLADALCLPQTGDGSRGVFGGSDSWGSSGGGDSGGSGDSGGGWGSGGSDGGGSSSSDSGSSS
jgi:uncharacterized protein (TIGR04222 family)